MAGSMQIDVKGVDDIIKKLNELTTRSAANVMRNTVTDIAREAAEKAKEYVPVDKGTLKRAIKAKRKRGTKDMFEAGVEVRRKATHGMGVKDDAWYWHFVEFGTLKQVAQPYITPAILDTQSRLDSLLSEFFTRRFEREVKRLSK